MNSNDLPKPSIAPAKPAAKVSIYLLEAWSDGESGTSYDSGRTIEVTPAQAELLISIGTAQSVEEES